MRPSGDGFDSERFRNQWVTTLRELRRELGFKIVGYVLEKREEKLNYMRKNPVKRGLVRQSGDWPWSRRGGEVSFSE